MPARGLALILLALTAFVSVGCGSSRYDRYRQNGRYGVYNRNRDYQIERARERRAREEWRRQQRLERQRRDRDWRDDRRRWD